MAKQIVLSSSRINLFLDCKLCFWMDIVKSIKRPSGPFPSLPSGMDRILKSHFDMYREINGIPPEIKDTGAKLFDNKNLLDEWRNNRKGIRWADPKSGIILMGAVDELLVKDDKLIVLDFKTRGYPVKEDTKESYENQLNIYSFLLEKNGHPTEDFAYLLFFHPNKVSEDGSVLFHRDLIKVKTDTKEAEKLFRKAVNCINGSKPEKNDSCEFCNWKK